jgi:4,5-dihydroxyphthalate decarboxylase
VDDTANLVIPQRGKNLYPIALAVADYDRTRPLIDGRVKPEGISLTTNTAWIGDFCMRPVYEEYDAAEMSFSWYVAARSRGEPCIALPIFLLRMPVLAYILVREDSPAWTIKDLMGKRIGAPGYRYTVNLWMRGILEDHYGMKATDVSWVTCEREGAGYVPPKDVDITIREGRTPEDLLLKGEVDAIFVPQLQESFLTGKSGLRRLFRDPQAEMRNYFRSTGIFPVTHVLVMKKELVEREPWIAENMYRAFTAAQRQCDELYRYESKMVSLPDAVFILEQQRAAWGENVWSHGLTPGNRKVVETFVRYAHAQNYIPRVPTVDELFAPNTLGL